jgi:ribosome-associated protein
LTASQNAIAMTKVAYSAAEEKLGENLVALDVSKPFVLTDVFLFVSGRNERQVASIADAIEEKLSLIHI